MSHHLAVEKRPCYTNVTPPGRRRAAAYINYFQLRQAEQERTLDVRDALEMKGLFRSGHATPSFQAQWKKAHPKTKPPAAPLRAYRCVGRDECVTWGVLRRPSGVTNV
eukprot:5283383-Pyramimonas_sp.AAC.1